MLTFVMKMFQRSCELFMVMVIEISENKMQSGNSKVKIFWDMKPSQFIPVQYLISTHERCLDSCLSALMRQQVSSKCHYLSTEDGSDIHNHHHDSLKFYIGDGSSKVAQDLQSLPLHTRGLV
jgi:hypothetical protein